MKEMRSKTQEATGKVQKREGENVDCMEWENR
jgi:hypothetical protein